MRRFRYFIVISFICHLVFVFSLIEVKFDKRDVDIYDVYEVSIVSAGPPSKFAPKAGTRTTGSKEKKYYYRRGSSSTHLDGISKENAGRTVEPELVPSKIEPEKRDYTDRMLPEEPAHQRAERSGNGSGYASGGSADAKVLQWKNIVRTTVEGLWKTPPEMSIMDMTLTTTYLLEISRNGDLLKKRLLMSSGNSPFDRSVSIALNSVKGFPPPPFVLIAGQDSVEVTISFTPPKGAE